MVNHSFCFFLSFVLSGSVM
uniref:Uncharacterized protein n=1 Tax=Anguilla anguilla TaxID=7936 RepID=A0A0E9VD47_ANGAN